MRTSTVDRPVCAYRLSLIVVLAALLLNGHLTAPAAADGDPEEMPPPVPSQDYAIYDRIIQAKFLTSGTVLVLIRRLTATRIGPEEVPFRRQFFDENEFFEGTLPAPLVREFLIWTRRPSQLEPKFRFGVRYRLVSDFTGDVEEAGFMLRPGVFAADDAEPRIRLEFSRVALTPTEDHALVYVGHYRFDGTGAGFLILLQPQPSGWEIQDTEVVWTMR